MAGIRYDDIGLRLKAFRLGSGYNADDIAERIGISRAALYRYEKGDPPKLETLDKIADLLDVSLPSLLGVGVEYVSSAVSFFERMRQLEEDSEHIFAMFGPVPYLLTSDAFDALLPRVLKEALPDSLPDRAQAERIVDEIVPILRERKERYRARKPSFVCLLSASELDRFLRHGFIGAYDLPPEEAAARRAAARVEVERIVELLESEPMGLQIGVLVDAMPNTSFQIFRQPDRSVLAVSPFRLGEFPNVRIGVAMITSAPEALDLYQRMTEEIWNRSLKGRAAAEQVRRYLAQPEVAQG